MNELKNLCIMKIRYYENLIIFFDSFFGIMLFLITTFAYFLGFSVNINTLPYYFIALFSILLLTVIIYLVYTLTCKTFVIFTNESIIKEKNGEVKMLIRHKDILCLNYYQLV